MKEAKTRETSVDFEANYAISKQTAEYRSRGKVSFLQHGGLIILIGTGFVSRLHTQKFQ